MMGKTNLMESDDRLWVCMMMLVRLPGGVELVLVDRNSDLLGERQVRVDRERCLLQMEVPLHWRDKVRHRSTEVD